MTERLSDEIVQRALAQVAEDKRLANERLEKIAHYLHHNVNKKLVLYHDDRACLRIGYMYCFYDWPEPWMAQGDSFIWEGVVPTISTDPIKVEVYKYEYDPHGYGF